MRCINSFHSLVASSGRMAGCTIGFAGGVRAVCLNKEERLSGSIDTSVI